MYQRNQITSALGESVTRHSQQRVTDSPSAIDYWQVAIAASRQVCPAWKLAANRSCRGSAWRCLGVAIILFTLLLTSACVQKLAYQPKYEPLDQSAFFADGKASRQLVEGTVARGMARTDALLYAGLQDGQPAEIFPFYVTEAVVQRGQERFNIYCAPCHSYTGDGNGLVVQRGFPAPPSLHEERLRQAPVGYIFTVITNGHGIMPSYSKQIAAEDRWAIIAYVRALQLSQYAPAAALPADTRQKVGDTP